MAGGTAGGNAGMDGGAGADAGPSDPFMAVTIPPALTPTGATLKFKAHGRGSQVYTCKATVTAADGGADAGDDGGSTVTTYAWSLKAPDAKLFDQDGKQIGTHFVGPTWMSTSDESDAVGMAVANEVHAGTIPWLLLKIVSHMGQGVFTDVTYVNRLLTTGGVAPTTGCDSTTVGTDMPVAYTADYYFYTGGVTAGDGGADAALEWPFATLTIPAGVATPDGTTLKLKLHGWGDQVYTCTAMGGPDAGADAGAATYSWVLKGPNATLYDETNTKKGMHTTGPTWTSTDTSSIVGMKQAQVDSTLSDAIPWLMLKVTSHAGGTGVFSDVTYIQRLNTARGKAPATGCDAAHVTMETSVAYSADYYFYTGDSPDAGTDAASGN
jgi:hypothetical protein